jgi:hypothetical protein
MAALLLAQQESACPADDISIRVAWHGPMLERDHKGDSQPNQYRSQQ